MERPSRMTTTVRSRGDSEVGSSSLVNVSSRPICTPLCLRIQAHHAEQATPAAISSSRAVRRALRCGLVRRPQAGDLIQPGVAALAVLVDVGDPLWGDRGDGHPIGQLRPGDQLSWVSGVVHRAAARSLARPVTARMVSGRTSRRPVKRCRVRHHLIAAMACSAGIRCEDWALRATS
jgi:hypothetical protein